MYKNDQVVRSFSARLELKILAKLGTEKYSKTIIHCKEQVMIEKLLPNVHHAEETLRRTVLKTISYRGAILILDFAAIYIFTGQIKVAVGFMIVSNIYTTLGYFIHERIWDKIKWGRIIYKKTDE